MEKVKVGIIGLGGMGSGHFNNIRAGHCPEIELVAVADINPARLEWCNGVCPEIATFATAEEMLDSGKVEAVIIATPHYYHPVYAIEAFKRNIHVMSEKPAGVYTKQVKQMNEEAKKAGVKFGVMFNQRTSCNYRAMRELIQSGKYGEIRRVNWVITNWFRTQQYYDSGSWRATWSGEGGGVLLNQSPHQLDLLQWICGMPVKVQAHLSYGKWHDIEVEDDVTAFMEFANGATGVFITSTGEFPGNNRFQVTLDKATITCDGGKPVVVELTASQTDVIKDHTIKLGANLVEVETDGKSTGHVGVLNAWAGAILHGTPLVAEGIEGINGVTLSNAMHLSDWLGKPVDLPFDDDLYFAELTKRIKSSKNKENATDNVINFEGTFNM